MIKVLVVDDDKLVRKGLIAAMPWNEFNMEVVGEANNGKNALKFLENNAVDLILLDLSMPIMSGLELMKIIRQKYPEVFVVILTMHKDFEYIQEALRLGAIDYIAKVQLEKESFADVLSRINRSISERKKVERGIVSKDDSFSFFQQDIGYALLFMEERYSETLLSGNRRIMSTDLIEIDSNILLYIPSSNGPIIDKEEFYKEITEQLKEKDLWTILQVFGLKNKNVSTVKRDLRRYYKNRFFYEYNHKEKIIEKALDELGKKTISISEEKQAEIESNWLSFDWINDIQTFREFCNQLKNLYYPKEKLIRLLTLIEGEWNRLYSSIISHKIELPDKLVNWQEVEKWLVDIYDLTCSSITKSKHSPEITRSIVKAIKIIHQEIYKQLTANDVAKRVNMSRGYFNKCFKEITGRSFNAYLRYIRFEKAKEYLCLTNEPIYLIAQWVGYNDEKYFSRVFREEFGLLPSEYREKNKR